MRSDCETGRPADRQYDGSRVTKSLQTQSPHIFYNLPMREPLTNPLLRDNKKIASLFPPSRLFLFEEIVNRLEGLLGVFEHGTSVPR